jgi:transcriptional regulator with XRE-family HTH domain
LKIDIKKLDIEIAKSCLLKGELAKAAKIDIVTLTRISKGTQEPRPQTIGKIAKALEVDVTEIIE